MNSFKFFVILGIASSLAGTFSARADDMIVSVPRADDHFQPVAVTPAALTEVMNSREVTVTRVTEEETLREAAARGVVVPATPTDSPQWGHPWFIVKAGVGMPGNINADIEIDVHDNVTIEGGIGTGLAANTFMGAIRWRPDATCWGCTGRNLFSIGFGVEGETASDNTRTDVLIAASVDAMYIHRFAEHFGWVIGIKAGPRPARPWTLA